MRASLGCAELTCKLQTPCWEAPDLPCDLHPSSLAILLPLIKFWLSMKLNLQIAALFFAFLYFFLVIIMHISYAHTLGTAGFEEGKLAKNNHLGWRSSTI